MRFKDIQDIIKGKLKLKGNENSEMALIKSAINQAYVIFAEKDCIIKETEFLSPSNTLDLPVDFLVYHSLYVTVTDIDLLETTIKIPRHYLEVKANKIMIRDDLLLDCNVISIKLVYGIKPEELKIDADVPVIKTVFHQGLVYYALFLITDNTVYYDLYMSIYNSIPIDNYVSSYSDVIDIL